MTHSKRNRANKRRGSAWEVSIRNYLIDQGFDAERLPKNGSTDLGDVSVRMEDEHTFIVEAKDTVRPELSIWLREAGVEADNYAKHKRKGREFIHPVVIYKRRNHGVEQAYVVMELGEWLDSL